MRNVKHLVARVLQSFGFRIERINPQSLLPAKFPAWADDLSIPPDHALRGILSRHPGYQSNLAIIARATSRKYPDGAIVDVGANIGDTARIFRSACASPLVCIEGDSYFYSFLASNTRRMENVDLIPAYLADGVACGSFMPVRGAGTIQLRKTDANEISFVTLDSLMIRNKHLANARLLKVDADGFDLKILRGAQDVIRRTSPVLFFEYDPVFFGEHDSQANTTVAELFDMGYEGLIIYDHLGRRLLATTANQISTITDIGNYLEGRQGLLPYVDICLTSRDDQDVYQAVQSNNF
jgi:FkbM family methyltransferase